MTSALRDDRLDAGLARLLSLGSWASCGLLALGMMLPATPLPAAGLVLLIALPTLRVAAMGLWFLRARERDLALVAALVLTIIVVSTVLGAGGA